MGALHRLTLKEIESSRPDPTGKLVTLFDGGGLLLQIRPGEGGRAIRNWVYRYRTPDGEMVVSKKTGTVYNRERNMGLGSYPDIGLAKARERAQEARRLVLDGVDPLERKHERRRAQRVARASLVTFDAATNAYLRQFESSWRSPVHKRQWAQSLADYARPVIGQLGVHQITPDDVLRCIGPIWQTLPRTALKGRRQSRQNRIFRDDLPTGRRQMVVWVQRNTSRRRRHPNAR
jgi:hypothetical protein